MTLLQTQSRQTARPPRWAVPPGLAPAGGPLEGWGILLEVDGAEGVALWQALRDTGLWIGGASTPLRSYQGLAPWRAELQALHAVGTDQPAVQARACIALARRTAGDGLPRTAAAFADAAARIAPAEPASLLEAARLLGQAGEPRRAEAWLRRAMVLSRRTGDRSTHGLACCAWGALLRERGDLAGAGERYTRAARLARRYGLWRVKPIAHWGLCTLAATAGRVEEATRHGRRAMRGFGRRDPRLALLAHDLAAAWCQAGYVAPALRVLRPAAEKMRGDPARSSVLATLQRATACAELQRPAPREVDVLSVDLADSLSLSDHDW